MKTLSETIPEHCECCGVRLPTVKRFATFCAKFNAEYFRNPTAEEACAFFGTEKTNIYRYARELKIDFALKRRVVKFDQEREDSINSDKNTKGGG